METLQDSGYLNFAPKPPIGGCPPIEHRRFPRSYRRFCPRIQRARMRSSDRTRHLHPTHRGLKLPDHLGERIH
jgi:hypothetical protein